jgi:predicted site-specific integrase-resolvase
MKTAAIYARVSSDKQKEENTIASQTAALTAFAAEQGYAVPTEWISNPRSPLAKERVPSAELERRRRRGDPRRR